MAALTASLPLQLAALTSAAGAQAPASVAVNPQAPVDATSVVRLYGAAGTFGGLDGATSTPSGERLSTRAVASWRFLPGQAAYFPAVAPDGTVIIANEPQTDNQLLPTGRELALSTFNPSTEQFRNVLVPTSHGATTLGGPWAASSEIVGGADVSDVGLIDVGGGQRRIAFTSAMPFWGWHAPTSGEYPTIGMLTQGRDRAWRPDLRRSRFASQLASTAARRARASRARAAGPHARRAASAIASACVLRSSAPTGRFGDCRMPAEFAQLPASRALVLAQYATDGPAHPSGRLTVVTPGGAVLASYRYPAIRTARGTQLTVHPREVEADPLGRPGDERFVVTFDAERGRGQAGNPSVPGTIQEFRFDVTEGTLTPTSPPLLTGARIGNQPAGAETTAFAADGSLWVGQSQVGTLQAGGVAVYQRTPGSAGVLAGRPGCGASARWRGQAWGRRCPPDQTIAEASTLGIARSLDEDPATGSIYLTTMRGAVLAMHRGAGGRITAGPPIDLGLGELADRAQVLIGPRKAALDAERRTLWIPIQQLISGRTCPLWPCAPRQLDQWLYAIDLSNLPDTRVATE